LGVHCLTHLSTAASLLYIITSRNGCTRRAKHFCMSTNTITRNVGKVMNRSGIYRSGSVQKLIASSLAQALPFHVILFKSVRFEISYAQRDRQTRGGNIYLPTLLEEVNNSNAICCNEDCTHVERYFDRPVCCCHVTILQQIKC